MSEASEKKLRGGFTTGSCATAATKAAFIALITKEKQKKVTIHLPIGQEASFEIASCSIENDKATASIIKDAGDDPDATHGAEIVATVSLNKNSNGILLDGGVGVGRVTKPGLPIPVGEPAINPVPRKMIIETVQQLLNDFELKTGVSVIISVPKGEEIAKKTLNARLGILGGISILGTRGTVVPFSTAAFKASIIQAIKVARAAGIEHVAITTGGRSEKYAMEKFTHLPEEAFIEMGDFVGTALKACKRLGIKRVTMVGMMGKFSKVAQGVMMVHSKSAAVDFNFLAQVAKETGANTELIAKISQANTASQVGDFMYEAKLQSFFTRLCECCNEHGLTEVGGGMQIETMIYTLKGELLGRAISND